MKIYIAAPLRMRDELRPYADKLQDSGHEVVSHWIFGRDTWKDEDKEGCFFANEDLEEVLSCDIFVFYLPRPREVVSKFMKATSEVNYLLSDENALMILRHGGVTGGKDVELGCAIALRKRLYGIGTPINVFHRLPQIQWFQDFEGFFKKFLEKT
jgi:nucleoside 2-deoxyribosyltransferase